MIQVQKQSFHRNQDPPTPNPTLPCLPKKPISGLQDTVDSLASRWEAALIWLTFKLKMVLFLTAHNTKKIPTLLTWLLWHSQCFSEQRKS